MSTLNPQGYTLGEEVANAVTHGLGAAAAIVALTLMLVKAMPVLSSCGAIFRSRSHRCDARPNLWGKGYRLAVPSCADEGFLGFGLAGIGPLQR